MASLAEIRAKLKASEQKGSGERTGGDKSIYPVSYTHLTLPTNREV